MIRSAILGLLLVAGCAPSGGSIASTGVTSGGLATGGTAPDTDAATSTATMHEAPTSSHGSSASTSATDMESGTTDGLTCERPGGCERLDILMVIDNSETMGQKQNSFVSALPQLLDRLRNLVGLNGASVETDVNLMVTTTDVGHPLCEIFKKPDYVPAKGAPISSACTERLQRFTSTNGVTKLPELCTNVCPLEQSARPSDPFLHFAGADHNVIAAEGVVDPVAQALACIVPQGIDGCGFEAPLEAMLRALDSEAAWNKGEQPFLREGAALAIIVVTDEADCSIEDFKYFDLAFRDHPEFGKYYAIDPVTMEKGNPNSSICWNGGMTCSGANPDGFFETCAEEYKGVLWPVSRYIDRLRESLRVQDGKPVFMLVIGGVPSVTAHSPEIPYHPIAGGVQDIVYHSWTDADLLPGDSENAAEKQFEYGIGPGCSSAKIGYGLPPGRLLDVCQALDLNVDSEVACCMESVCDGLEGAMGCLTGMASRRLFKSR